jgi:hypothetical protein
MQQKKICTASFLLLATIHILLVTPARDSDATAASYNTSAYFAVIYGLL